MTGGSVSGTNRLTENRTSTSSVVLTEVVITSSAAAHQDR